MARLKFTLDLAASPEHVFTFFVPQRMPYWYGAEMECAFEVSDGAPEFRVGQKVRITGRAGRRQVSLTAVVTRYAWPRLLEWRLQDAYGVKGLQSWLAEPSSGGAGFSLPSSSLPATRLTMRDEYELLGRFGRLWDGLVMRHAVARRDRAWLARLRRLVEQR